jgi:hypothetical protein
MIKLVNGIPEKFTEMDEKVKFLQQVDQEVGPVILINKFNVDPEEVDEFLKAFAATDKVLKRQPDTYLRSYIVGTQVVVHSSTTKSGNLPNNLNKLLPALNFYRA